MHVDAVALPLQPAAQVRPDTLNPLIKREPDSVEKLYPSAAAPVGRVQAFEQPESMYSEEVLLSHVVATAVPSKPSAHAQPLTLNEALFARDVSALNVSSYPFEVKGTVQAAAGTQEG